VAHFIEEECVSCGVCAENCPEKCISPGEEAFLVDPEHCTDCGECMPVCPIDCISVFETASSV
jgi:ferredoxin